MSKNLSVADIGNMLDEGLDLEDVNTPGRDLLVLEPLDIEKLKKDPAELINQVDLLIDYAIVRKVNHHSLDQAQQVLKAAAEMIKANPSARNIDAMALLIKSISDLSNQLVQIHIDINTKLAPKDDKKDEEDSDMENTSNFIQRLKEGKK